MAAFAVASPSAPVAMLVTKASVAAPRAPAAARAFATRPSLARASRTVSRVERVAASAEPEVEAPAAAPEGNFVPVIAPEDLPKGVRKEVNVGGRNILVFWYRNEIFATESRSPAEGAYSEGFLKAKFTQDYGIECPSTGSVFSLKDGSIKEWYPNNSVLRALTPQETCRNLIIYPVQLTSEAICVNVDDVGGTESGAALGKGGMGTSLENNNVFAVEPKVYVNDPSEEIADEGKISIDAGTAATAVISLLGVGIIGVAGTATALYYEDIPLLVAFWALLSIIAFFVGKPFFVKDEE